MNYKKIQKTLDKFSRKRNWKQFHTPKNLSMALSVEVSELIEIFQWSNSGGLEEIKDKKIRKNIEEEIADIFVYLLRLCDVINIDIEKAIKNKIDINELKYPIDKSFDSSKKYKDL
jgi:DNA phosphorothioation-dependent restriction protein DptG